MSHHRYNTPSRMGLGIGLGIGRKGKGGPSIPVRFSWNPEFDTTVPANAAFTNTATAQTVATTTDGTVFWDQTTKPDEVPFARMRRTENLLDSATGSGPFTDINETGRVCVSVEASNGTLTITIGGVPTVFTPTGTPQTFAAFADVAGVTAITISGTATLNEPMAHLVEVGGLDVPESYVQHDLEYGNIGVLGVRVLNTANLSTVDGNGVVTFLTGAALANIRPNPGLSGISVPARLAIVNGVPNVDFVSTVISPTSIFVRTTGDDGNDGLTVGNALRTVDKAFDIVSTSGIDGDPFKIDIGSGRWYDDQVFPSAPIGGTANAVNQRPIEITGAGQGSTFLLNAEDPTGVSWSDNADGTYTATVTDASHAVDMATADSFGNPTALSKVADLTALLAASEGFFVVGSDIRVKPIRAGAPDNDLLVFLAAAGEEEINFFRNADGYFHDMAWLGWQLVVQPSSGIYDNVIHWLIEDSLYGYTNTFRNGLTFQQRGGFLSQFYLRRVDIAYPAFDGADYNLEVFAVEEDCNMYGAGAQNTATNSAQSSSGHQATQILRSNSVFNPILASASANIADVDAGTRSWSYNIVADEQDYEHAWVDTVDGAEFTTPVIEYFFDNVTNIQGTPPAFTPFDGIERAGYFTQFLDNLSGPDWPVETSALIDVSVGPLAATSVMFGFGADNGAVVYNPTSGTLIGLNDGLFVQISPSTSYANEKHKFAFSMKDAELIVVDDEGGSGQDLTGTPVFGSIHVGCNSVGTQNYTGIVHNFIVYEQTQTLVQLQSLVN